MLGLEPVAATGADREYLLERFLLENAEAEVRKLIEEIALELCEVHCVTAARQGVVVFAFYRLYPAEHLVQVYFLLLLLVAA